MPRPDDENYPREDPPPPGARSGPARGGPVLSRGSPTAAAEVAAPRPLFVDSYGVTAPAGCAAPAAPARDRGTFVFVSPEGGHAAEVDTVLVSRAEWLLAPESRDSAWLPRFVGGHVLAVRLTL